MDNNGNKRRINYEEEQPTRIRRRDFDMPGLSYFRSTSGSREQSEIIDILRTFKLEFDFKSKSIESAIVE